MNKIHIFGIMALAALSFTACNPDDSPKLNEVHEFTLNTPPFANQLYQLTPDGIMEFTCSQPDYGMALAPEYAVEVALSEAAFTAEAPAEGEAPNTVTILPDEPFSATIHIHESDVAKALVTLRGIETEEEYVDVTAPLYVRAVCAINKQEITAAWSNIVKLPQVKGYSTFGHIELDVIYNPGNSNEWNFNAAMQLLNTGKDNEKIYTGFLYLDGDFKFTDAPDWSHGNFGFDSDLGDGHLKDGSSDNLKLPSTGAGLYYAKVDLEKLTYQLTFINDCGVVGAFNNWGAGNPTLLTPNGNFTVWTFSGPMTEGEFKFIFNKGWQINLGGTLDFLKENGDNLNIEGNGNFTITLDLSKLPYSAKIEES